MPNKLDKCAGKLSDYIKSKDNYGQKVSLTLEGEDSFKSLFGGILTLLLWTGLYAYGIYWLITNLTEPF